MGCERPKEDTFIESFIIFQQVLAYHVNTNKSVCKCSQRARAQIIANKSRSVPNKDY